MLHTKLNSKAPGLVLISLTVATPMQAATYYVDSNVLLADCASADGSAAKPFCTIQEGVNQAAASGDTVQVAAGDYDAVEIKSKSLRLLGADPTTTVIWALNDPNPVALNYGIYVHEFVEAVGNVEIAGFSIIPINTITTGVKFYSRFTAANLSGSLHNCILLNNKYAVWIEVANVKIFNNVITGSTNRGVFVNGGFATLTSNILTNNETGFYVYGQGFSSYNTYADNTIHRTSNDSWSVLTSTNDQDDVDPLFVNSATNDYHVQPTSTTINAGSPAPVDKDPDGTRNDKGAYGGPGSAGFFPTPIGLPTVTTLSISPSNVMQSGTFTIQAIGQAPQQ